MTGAAAGLGAGIAGSLACGGAFARIGITYRNTAPVDTLAAIERSGVAAFAGHVDFLGDATAVGDALADVVAACGPVDTLVHCVGPLIVKRFERIALADYVEMFDGNVRSSVQAVQAVLPAMRDARFGRIVLFGMSGSAQTLPHRGFTLHQAAKSAVVAFARCLALEEAKHGVTVNVIEPGDIRRKTLPRQTALELAAKNPRGRPGSYEDVADVVAFLVAPERDFVTGAVIAANGGLTEADERNASPS